MNTKLRNKLLPYLFLLPTTLLLLFVFIIPFIGTIYISMTDWNGISRTMNFIGLQNFKDMLQENSIGEALKNNFIYFIMLVFIQNIIGLVLALFVNSKLIGKNIFQAIFFIPAIISTVAVGFIWSFIFDPMNGPIPYLIEKLHMGFLQNYEFLGSMNSAIYIVSFISIWQWAGWNMVVYIAGLQSVPQELYESASIDGASSRAKFFHVTLPMLAPSITVNIVASSIGALKIFDLPFVLTRGGPGHATESIAISIYNNCFTSNKMGYGTAISLILFFLVIAVSIVQTVYLRKREEVIS